MLSPSSLNGLRMGAVTAMSALVLDKEEASLAPVNKYVDAVAMSLFNLLFIGPLLHGWVVDGLRRRDGPLRTIFKAGAMVVVHSGIYAFVHRCMHRVAAMRHMHSPHHEFVDDVSPVVANAVTPDEFLLAYMMPFVVGARLLRPNEAALNAAVAVVSAANLAVHSPRLKGRSFPRLLVSADDHLEHHRTRSRKYAAPTIAWFRVWPRRSDAKAQR